MFNPSSVLQPSFIDQPLDELWAYISPLYSVDESLWLEKLIALAEPCAEERKLTVAKATGLISRVRKDKKCDATD